MVEKAYNCTVCNKSITIVNVDQEEAIRTLESTMVLVSSYKGYDFPLCESCYNLKRKNMTDHLHRVLKRNEEYVAFAHKNYNILLCDDALLQQTTNHVDNDTSYHDHWDQIFQAKKRRLAKLRQQNQTHFERSCQTLERQPPLTAHGVFLESPIVDPPDTMVHEEEEEVETYRNQIQRLKSQVDELMHKQDDEEHAQQHIQGMLNETKLMRSYYEWEQQRLNRDEDIVNKQLVELDRELLSYGKAEVINDVFPIGFDGHFGTINKFKLGRLPSMPVNWEEINAALGQCMYLLEVLARSNAILFSIYELRPCGATSQLALKSGGYLSSTTLELSARPSGLFWKKAFNKALVAFLSCIKDMGDQANARAPHFQMPYHIDDHLINKVSIKFYSDKTVHLWTQALKYMLTNLKSLILWHVQVRSSTSSSNL